MIFLLLKYQPKVSKHIEQVLNTKLSEQVPIINLLNYPNRYRLYGEWKNESYERHPEMQVARAKIIDKTKYIMRLKYY